MSEATADPLPSPTELVEQPQTVRQLAEVDRVLKLLVLYRKKLLRASTRFSPSQNRLPHTRDFLRLRPAVQNLARYASGLIQNVRISQIDKIELQLRLAEMESALDDAVRTIL